MLLHEESKILVEIISWPNDITVAHTKKKKKLFYFLFFKHENKSPRLMYKERIAILQN